MDLSDLPQSAQDRVAAAEIEADSILTESHGTASSLTAQAYRLGVDPSGIGFSPGDIPLDLARQELDGGRDRAAGHLFGATAGEYLKAGKLDTEAFNGKLEEIGGWIARKYHTNRTVLDQLKQHCRGVALRKRAADREAGESTEAKKTIIARLPAETLVRMEAETAAFLADYLPKLEREASKRGPVHDAELLRELVIHQFNLVARECLAVCASVEEFEKELRSDIARFVRYGLSQHTWLAEPMRQELDRGFALFVMGANPWVKIPEKDRATVWHVGAITGEALSHAALKLRAEGWKHAAGGGFAEANKPGASEQSSRAEPGPVVGETNGTGADQRAAIDAFITKLGEAGRKITRKDFWTVAGYKDPTEFERFQRGDTRTTKSAATAFNRVLNMKPEDFIRSLDSRSPAA